MNVVKMECCICNKKIDEYNDYYYVCEDCGREFCQKCFDNDNGIFKEIEIKTLEEGETIFKYDGYFCEECINYTED